MPTFLITKGTEGNVANKTVADSISNTTIDYRFNYR